MLLRQLLLRRKRPMPAQRNGKKRQKARRNSRVEYVYDAGGEPGTSNPGGPEAHSIPKGLVEFPSWLRTLVAIVVTAVSAGAGLTIWLNGHYVSQERFDVLLASLDKADYVSRTDYQRQVEAERVISAKADQMAADFASLKTDLTWVKLTLARIEEQQKRGAK